MAKVKNFFVGTAIFEPGTHFVLVSGDLDTKNYMSDTVVIDGGEQNQLFVPDGYTIRKFSTPPDTLVWYGQYSHWEDQDNSEGSILYVNNKKVKVKVYEREEKKFCPDFGEPVITSKHR